MYGYRNTKCCKCFGHYWVHLQSPFMTIVVVGMGLNRKHSQLKNALGG